MAPNESLPDRSTRRDVGKCTGVQQNSHRPALATETGRPILASETGRPILATEIGGGSRGWLWSMSPNQPALDTEAGPMATGGGKRAPGESLPDRSTWRDVGKCTGVRQHSHRPALATKTGRPILATETGRPTLATEIGGGAGGGFGHQSNPPWTLRLARGLPCPRRARWLPAEGKFPLARVCRTEGDATGPARGRGPRAAYAPGGWGSAAPWILRLPRLGHQRGRSPAAARRS